MEALIWFIVGLVFGIGFMSIVNTLSYRKGRVDGIAETMQAIYKERTPDMIRSLLREVRTDV